VLNPGDLAASFEAMKQRRCLPHGQQSCGYKTYLYITAVSVRALYRWVAERGEYEVQFRGYVNYCIQFNISTVDREMSLEKHSTVHLVSYECMFKELTVISTKYIMRPFLTNKMRYSHSSFINRCTFIRTLIKFYIKIRWLLHVLVCDHHLGACISAWPNLY